MPIISLEVNETIESVVRPLTMDVVRNVMERTRVPLDTQIILNKPGSGPITIGSGLLGNPEEAQMDYGKIVQVEAEEEYPPEGNLTMYVPKSDHETIFYDEALGIWVKPIYTDARLNLSFRLRFESENAANSWLNGVKRRIGAERQSNLHTGSYHFPIPDEVLYALMKLHQTREAQAGYGDTFGAYLKAHFRDRVEVIATQSGHKQQFVVSETQTGMAGWFTFDEVPKLQKNTQDWLAEFTYVFEYQKPISFSMGYPLMVHNKLIPKNLRVRGENYNQLRNPSYANSQKSRYMRLGQGELMPGETIGGVSLPEFDEWLPDYVRHGYSTLLRVMIALKPDELITIGDLDKLPGMVIDSDLRAYMAKYHKQLTQSGQCAVHIVLYSDDEIMAEDAIYVDEFLVVHAKEPLDLRKRYHLWIGMISDVMHLSDDGVDGIIENGETAKKLISVIDDRYPVDDIPMMEDGTISPPIWNEIKVELRESSKHFKNDIERNCMTVGNFVVVAHRQ